MVTWPSGSKASTEHLDSGSDKPRLARPDIKQNIDNTNDIIDMFNITSPQDNQFLAYDQGTARFELQTFLFQEASFQIRRQELDDTDSGIKPFPLEGKIDPFNIITAFDDYRFTVGAGTYEVSLFLDSDGNVPTYVSTVGVLLSLELYGEDSTTQTIPVPSGVNRGLSWTTRITPTAPAEYYLRWTGAGATGTTTINTQPVGLLKILKLA